jgi:hypothetical protein
MAPDEYRRNAMECMRMAEGVSHPAMKVSLLQMAEKWLQLYDHSLRNTGFNVSEWTPRTETSVPQQQQQQQQQRTEPGGDDADG